MVIRTKAVMDRKKRYKRDSRQKKRNVYNTRETKEQE